MNKRSTNLPLWVRILSELREGDSITRVAKKARTQTNEAGRIMRLLADRGLLRGVKRGRERHYELTVKGMVAQASAIILLEAVKE